MSVTTHRYSNKEITVLWQPMLCKHSGICFKGLAAVFDPRRKPWIDMNQSTSAIIIEQVKQCPSGALSIVENPAAT